MRGIDNAPVGGSSEAIGARIENDLNLPEPAQQALRDATRTAADLERQACANANQALAQVSQVRVCQ